MELKEEKSPWRTYYPDKSKCKEHLEFLLTLINNASDEELYVIYEDVNECNQSLSKSLHNDLFEYFRRVKYIVLQEFKKRNKKIPKLIDRFAYYYYKKIYLDEKLFFAGLLLLILQCVCVILM